MEHKGTIKYNSRCCDLNATSSLCEGVHIYDKTREQSSENKLDTDSVVGHGNQKTVTKDVDGRQTTNTTRQNSVIEMVKDAQTSERSQRTDDLRDDEMVQDDKSRKSKNLSLIKHGIQPVKKIESPECSGIRLREKEHRRHQLNQQRILDNGGNLNQVMRHQIAKKYNNNTGNNSLVSFSRVQSTVSTIDSSTSTLIQAASGRDRADGLESNASSLDTKNSNQYISLTYDTSALDSNTASNVGKTSSTNAVSEKDVLQVRQHHARGPTEAEKTSGLQPQNWDLETREEATLNTSARKSEKTRHHSRVQLPNILTSSPVVDSTKKSETHLNSSSLDRGSKRVSEILMDEELRLKQTTESRLTLIGQLPGRTLESTSINKFVSKQEIALDDRSLFSIQSARARVGQSELKAKELPHDSRRQDTGRTEDTKGKFGMLEEKWSKGKEALDVEQRKTLSRCMIESDLSMCTKREQTDHSTASVEISKLRIAEAKRNITQERNRDECKHHQNHTLDRDSLKRMIMISQHDYHPLREKSNTTASHRLDYSASTAAAAACRPNEQHYAKSCRIDESVLPQVSAYTRRRGNTHLVGKAFDGYRSQLSEITIDERGGKWVTSSSSRRASEIPTLRGRLQLINSKRVNQADTSIHGRPDSSGTFRSLSRIPTLPRATCAEREPKRNSRTMLLACVDGLNQQPREESCGGSRRLGGLSGRGELEHCEKCSLTLVMSAHCDEGLSKQRMSTTEEPKTGERLPTRKSIKQQLSLRQGGSRGNAKMFHSTVESIHTTMQNGKELPNLDRDERIQGDVKAQTVFGVISTPKGPETQQQRQQRISGTRGRVSVESLVAHRF